ncbi:MAG: hypothetical protein O7I42_19055 [Alphaproteobacteria bacterium]|nr:hypothetical protein [Alphaproteobacteria bacterium]
MAVKIGREHRFAIDRSVVKCLVVRRHVNIFGRFTLLANVILLGYGIVMRAFEMRGTILPPRQIMSRPPNLPSLSLIEGFGSSSLTILPEGNWIERPPSNTGACSTA